MESEQTSDALDRVMRVAAENQKPIDEYAVCCSDGDYEYTRSADEALVLLEQMRDMHESLTGDRADEYEYDIAVLDAEYEHAGLWECDGCGEEFIVETKLGPLNHALGCGNDE